MDIQGRDHYPHFQMHPRSQPAAGAWWWGRCNKLRVHRSRSAHQPAGADPVSTFDVQHRQKTLLLRLDMHWEEQPCGRCDWLAMGQHSRDLFHRGRRICILQSVFWPCCSHTGPRSWPHQVTCHHCFGGGGSGGTGV